MTTQSTCPNCWQLLIELKWLQAKLEQAEAKIAALEAEVRRGQRLVAPFLRKNRYRAVVRGGGGSVTGVGRPRRPFNSPNGASEAVGSPMWDTS
jgi:hypothetical protein